MVFPNRSAAPAPLAPMTPGAPPAPPTAPAPPAAPAVARNFWCGINGMSVLKTEAEARALPPNTAAMTEDQKSGWTTLGALLGAAPAGAAPAAAPTGRAAFGQRAAPAASAAPAPGVMPRGMFAGVENAEVIRRGNNINAGDYICRVCSSEFKAGRQKNFVITELEVIKSSYEEANPSTHACNREGSRMTNFVGQNDNFASNIKEIILAVSGFDSATGKSRDPEDTVSQQECEALVSPEQPYAGAMVYIEAREVDTKSGGKFTRVSWWPCPVLADGSPDEQKLFSQVR